MYDGFLAIDGIEVLNRARAAAYLAALMPNIEVECTDPGLAKALGHTVYTLPGRDSAEWTRVGQVAAGRFLGLLPGKVQGSEDSTRGVQVSELSGNGAILTSPRYGAKEMRFVATAFALDEEAMEEGMAWLRQVLSNEGCSEKDLGCTGREVRLFAALPETTLAAYTLSRTFHKVEVTEGPLVTNKFPSKTGVIWQVEFTLTAGIPWAFTSLASVGTLDMDTASNFLDPVGEDCSALANPYDDFVADPFFTAISRPPRPPVILPPNILNITSWRRQTLTIPAAHTSRWGRAVPVVNVVTEGTEAQYLRLRFYREGAVSCDFDGEFLISYLPANSTLTLDAITREATLKLADGRTVPAGHLLFGSQGTPFLWPTLGCQRNYTMTADLMPGQSGVAVILETAVRD